jgi:hypothetical protein
MSLPYPAPFCESALADKVLRNHSPLSRHWSAPFMILLKWAHKQPFPTPVAFFLSPTASSFYWPSLSLEYSSADCYREHSEHYPSCKCSDYGAPQMGPSEACREQDPKRQYRMAREEHHFLRQQQCRKRHRRCSRKNMTPKWTVERQPNECTDNAETRVLFNIL